MNLKDAYRYAKFLDSIFSQVGRNFYTQNNFVKVTEKHLKSAMDSTAIDTEESVVFEKPFDGNEKTLVKALEDILLEKARISSCIDNFKKEYKVNWKEDGEFISIDTAIDLNKTYRSMADNLGLIKDMKSKVAKRQERSFRINAEGNQTPYVYNVEVVTNVDFDRDFVVENYKKLLNKADKISTIIDAAMSYSFEFEPKFSLYDTAKDIISQYDSK